MRRIMEIWERILWAISENGSVLRSPICKDWESRTCIRFRDFCLQPIPWGGI